MTSNLKNQSKSQLKTSKIHRKSDQIKEMSDLLDLQSLQTFDDLFEKQRKIGEGAQSVVYQCLQKKTGNKFAVKMMRSVGQEFNQMLKKQYKILKSLNHPHITKVHYLFLNGTQNKCYLVTDLFDYPSLRQYITQKQKLDQNQAAKIIVKIMKGVQYLHSKGVCHRDLKPQNIMYNPQTEDLKIIDFQIAKRKKYQHQQLKMWTNTGTLHYKAPQMFNGQYDQKIDIWAIGIIAFELLVGFLPFNGKFHYEVVRRIISQNPLDQQNFQINVLSNECKKFLDGLLKKDPTLRIALSQALKQPYLLKRISGSTPKKTFKLRRADTTNTQGLHLYAGSLKRYDQQNASQLLSTSQSRDIGIRCFGI